MLGRPGGAGQVRPDRRVGVRRADRSGRRLARRSSSSRRATSSPASTRACFGEADLTGTVTGKTFKFSFSADAQGTAVTITYDGRDREQHRGQGQGRSRRDRRRAPSPGRRRSDRLDRASRRRHLLARRAPGRCGTTCRHVGAHRGPMSRRARESASARARDGLAAKARASAAAPSRRRRRRTADGARIYKERCAVCHDAAAAAGDARALARGAARAIGAADRRGARSGRRDGGASARTCPPPRSRPWPRFWRRRADATTGRRSGRSGRVSALGGALPDPGDRCRCGTAGATTARTRASRPRKAAGPHRRRCAEAHAEVGVRFRRRDARRRDSRRSRPDACSSATPTAGLLARR